MDWSVLTDFYLTIWNKSVEIVKENVPSICSILIALLSSYTVIRSAKKARREEWAKRLRDHLESFYYPFLLLAKKTTQLYNALTKLAPIESPDPNDGCITYLLKGNEFKGNALTVFEEILNNDKELNNLILSNSKVISNSVLREKLSKLSNHYTVLELVYNNHLVGESDLFGTYSFPSKVIDDLEAEVKKLESKIEEYFENKVNK